MWESMNPARRVASPRSTTVAPAGTARFEPISLIFDPSTTITAPATVASERPSNILAALRTVTAGAGDWAPSAQDRSNPISATATRLISRILHCAGRADVVADIGRQGSGTLDVFRFVVGHVFSGRPG